MCYNALVKRIRFRINNAVICGGEVTWPVIFTSYQIETVLGAFSPTFHVKTDISLYHSRFGRNVSCNNHNKVVYMPQDNQSSDMRKISLYYGPIIFKCLSSSGTETLCETVPHYTLVRLVKLFYRKCHFQNSRCVAFVVADGVKCK